MDASAKKKKDEKEKDQTSSLKSSTFSGLKWRSIGPAFTSGRIADIVVNPNFVQEHISSHKKFDIVIGLSIREKEQYGKNIKH